MNAFLDAEFTGLHQNGELISLAIVTEDNRAFYAEFSDLDYESLGPWQREHVLPQLGLEKTEKLKKYFSSAVFLRADSFAIKTAVEHFFSGFDNGQVTVWGDNHAYDWVFFCQLWGGALHIPACFHYIVRDLASLFQLKKLDAGTSRRDFAGNGPHLHLSRHHALADAIAQKLCYDKLMSL